LRLFTIFVLAPALAFNLYAISRFWRETGRAKSVPERERSKKFTAQIYTMRIRHADGDGAQKPRRLVSEAVASGSAAIVMFASARKKGAAMDPPNSSPPIH
jgi:hypothetical protein